MIERVAKAIRDAAAKTGFTEDQVRYEAQTGDKRLDWYFPQAKAAIKAIREPINTSGIDSDIWQEMVETWHDMIDLCLK